MKNFIILSFKHIKNSKIKMFFRKIYSAVLMPCCQSFLKIKAIIFYLFKEYFIFSGNFYIGFRLGLSIE